MKEQIEKTMPPHVLDLKSAIEKNRELYEAIKSAYENQQKARRLSTGLISGGTLGSLIVGVLYPPALISLATLTAISYVGITLYESSKESYVSKKSSELLDEEANT
jgi:hypothetical protein